jgi:hypothetical protein
MTAEGFVAIYRTLPKVEGLVNAPVARKPLYSGSRVAGRHHTHHVAVL